MWNSLEMPCAPKFTYPECEPLTSRRGIEAIPRRDAGGDTSQATIMNTPKLRTHTGTIAAYVAFALVATSVRVRAQTAASDAASPTSEAAVILSPFTVSTDKDTGYQATNSISGTRLNTSIKDLPMPIEVITKAFIADTGSTDLRSALQYSAGILLQTQNDLENIGANAYQGPGGVNNPEGVTANPNDVQFKIRGFVTQNTLRDGFVRQNSTDAVNIDRIEVVRGPAALLYGTGNFGGVVNYLTKQPQDVRQGYADFTVGTYGLARSTVDVTGPISAANHLDFRLTAAVQTDGSYIQYYKENHFFVSPSLEWKPTSTTDVYADFEYGMQNQNGTGFQELRSVAGVGINNDQNEHGGLYTPPGGNPRTFRLSGKDTYANSQASNGEIRVTQQLLPGLNALVGYNTSKYDFQNRDVLGELTTNQGPMALQQTITLTPISSQGDSSLNIQNGTVPNAIDQYTWTMLHQSTIRNQERAELTYHLALFENANKWFHWENTVLAGYSSLYNENRSDHAQTAPNVYDYKKPNDLNPIVFGTQGDGSVDAPMFSNDSSGSKAWDRARYLTYQGRFLDNRIMLLSGVRWDINDAWNTDTSINAPGQAPTTSTNQGESQHQKTYQNGISIQLTHWLSVYALRSEGIQPNFSGQIQAATGAPAGSSLAKSREEGLKFDFLNGKISGTVSRYTITRNGWVGAPWYSPVTLGAPRFNPNKDIVYNVSNFTPTSAGAGGSNGGISAGASTALLDQPGVLAAWNQAVASGAAFRSSAGNGSPTWYVDASKADGANYFNTAFAANQADSGAEWPGFLYQGENGDSLVNNATMDTMAFHGGGSNNAAFLETDRSHGWDAQILYAATDNLQFVLSGAITTVERLSFGTWMKYPYNDPWAVWNFQNGSWGLLGAPYDKIYTVKGDTSSRTGYGQAAGDDTPKYHYDFWVNYRFTHALKGFSAGLGGYWESKREYESGVTHGSGQLIQNSAGQLLVLYTPSRYDIDCMAKYEWKAMNHPQYVQLNINNLLNDQKLYGLIYSAPFQAKLLYGIRF